MRSSPALRFARSASRSPRSDTRSPGASARRWRRSQLEPREFALLRAVGAAEGLSQQAAGERLQIPPSRMVAFVDALEARAAARTPAQPARSAHARAVPDPRGRELLERAFELAAGLERHLCAQLSADEREQLLDLLQRVGSQLGLRARERTPRTPIRRSPTSSR